MKKIDKLTIYIMFMVIVTLAFNLLLDTKTAHGILGDVYCLGNVEKELIHIEGYEPEYVDKHQCTTGLGGTNHGAGWHFSFMHWFIVLVNIFLLVLRAVHLYTWYDTKSEN